MLQLLKLPDGTVKVLVEGGQRARDRRASPTTSDFFEANADADGRERPAEAKELEALARTVVSQFEQYVKLNKKIPPEVLVSINQIEEPAQARRHGRLAPVAEDRREAGAARDSTRVSERLERVYACMEGEIGVLQVEKRIRSRVKRQMEKTQREYYLNEQMKAIQKELGEGEDGRDELAELEERIKKTKLSQGSAREGAWPS